MLTIEIIPKMSVLILIFTLLSTSALSAQSNVLTFDGTGPQEIKNETKVSVFFGTTKVLSLGELRTNAVEALKIKHYTVPEPNNCVINVQVQGKESGCVVMFWDHNAKMRYVVTFDAHGNVSNVRSSVIRHGTPAPGDPRPKLPEGGVSVRP